MYIAFDTETSGLHAECQILTAHFIILDENFKELDSYNLKLKHKLYKIEAKAMTINKIDLVKHDISAVTVNMARNSFLVMLRKYNKRLIPIGHNVSFDLRFLKKSGLLTDIEFNQYISSNVLDTMNIAQYLKACRVIPEYQSLSLKNLCHFYNIELENDELHTAEYDIKITIELLKRFIKLLSSEQKDTLTKKRKVSAVE